MVLQAELFGLTCPGSLWASGATPCEGHITILASISATIDPPRPGSTHASGATPCEGRITILVSLAATADRDSTRAGFLRSRQPDDSGEGHGGSVSVRIGNRRDTGTDEDDTRGVLPPAASVAAAAAPVGPPPVSPLSLRPSRTHPSGASSSDPDAETVEEGGGGEDRGVDGRAVEGAAEGREAAEATRIYGVTDPPGRRISPMAAVRWGEASKPGPRHPRRPNRQGSGHTLEEWRARVAQLRAVQEAHTRRPIDDWRARIASRREALRLEAERLRHPAAPPGCRNVTANDNVPHLRDPAGCPYLVDEDGGFWQHWRGGVRSVAYEERRFQELVQEVEDFGGVAAGLPMPVLVQPDGTVTEHEACPTTVPPRAAPTTQAIGRGDEVDYQSAQGDWQPAVVVEVHYDDELVPYFAVDVSGRIVDTGPSRLRRRPAAPAVTAVERDEPAAPDEPAAEETAPSEELAAPHEPGAEETAPIDTAAVHLRHDGVPATTLRAPVGFYFVYSGNTGLTAGASGIGGVSVTGGCDTSPRRRAEFERHHHVQADEDARSVAWDSIGGVDVVMSSVKSNAFSIDHTVGARAAARSQHHRAVRAILSSGATIGVVESMWQVTTCEEGSYFKELVREAAEHNYATRYRVVSPHRHGGSEVRPRMYLLFVRHDALALAGEPDLVAGDKGVAARTVAQLLIPGHRRREAVPPQAIRWRRHPEKIGGAVRLGHYGRGGLRNSVWSVDAAAPPRSSSEESPVFWLGGTCVRLTPREEARARGLGDYIDIGEKDGSTTARRRVAEASSVHAVAAVSRMARDYVHRVRAARRAAPREPTGDAPVAAHPAPRLRRSPNHAPQYCTRPSCRVCDLANLTLTTRRGTFSAASAWQRLESYCFRRLATHRPSAFLEEGEASAHRRVVSALTDNLHGFRYISRDGSVVQVAVLRRDLVFWRFRDPTMRAWARDGAPAFAVHPRPPPTRRGNYPSGDGDHARDMFRGFHDDGIIARVDTETAELALQDGSAALTPITLIPKKTAGKFRLLTDARASGTNWALGHLPSHFPTSLMAIQRVVAPGDWVGGFDVKDYFYCFPLRDGDSWLFLVRTSDGYYRYMRLPQGSKTSPYVGLRFTYHIIEAWRDGRGPLRLVVQEPGALDFDPAAPSVLWLDSDGERVEATRMDG